MFGAFAALFILINPATPSPHSLDALKKDLETIAKHLAARGKVAPGLLFRPDERIPEQKPG